MKHRANNVPSVIGLTLVVAADSGFITLFIVILFHQIFEGFALGSRIAMIPSSFLKKAILGGAFSITTPIGMAIGIGQALVIGFLYWAAYSIAIALGRSGVMAPLLAGWLTNLLFLSYGCYLYLKVSH